MGIKEIQDRLLCMGKTIATILEHRNIPYMITFGTLLGAVRHKGFIPWDDDFDLFLFDDSYNQALDALREELPRGMFLEYFDSEPLYFHNFAHVKDLGTIVSCKQYPQDSAYAHKGLCIDLYRAKRMTENKLEEYLLTENLAYLERRYKSGWLDFDVFETKSKEIKEKMSQISGEGSDRELLGFALEERKMELDDVFPLKKYVFEDAEFYGPANYDSLLSSFYGDYMTLPSKEHRHPHYDSVELL